MIRRLILTAILGVGLAVSALCIVARWKAVGWNSQTTEAGYGLFFHRPGLQFHRFTLGDTPTMREGNVLFWRMGVGYFAFGNCYPGKFTLIGPGWESGGYRVIGDEDNNAAKYLRYRALVLPPWLLFVLFVVAPTALLLRGPVRRWRRRKRNLCVLCGYNLTGNTSGVCPECGKRI